MNRPRNEVRTDGAAAGWIIAYILLFAIATTALVLSVIAYIHTLPAPVTSNCTVVCNGTASVCNCTAALANVTGAAEFIRTTQSPNDSVPPGTAFTIDTEVFNSMPVSVVSSAGAGGTVFTLATGLYELEYELSLGSAGSVALYTGATAGSLTVDTNTIAGSSTATTWIHGTALINVPGTLVVALSSHTGTAAIVTAGNAAGFFMVRMNIQKIA